MDIDVIAYLIKHPEILDNFPSLARRGEEKFNSLKVGLVEDMRIYVKVKKEIQDYEYIPFT